MPSTSHALRKRTILLGAAKNGTIFGEIRRSPGGGAALELHGRGRGKDSIAAAST
jgi:hypothetical protein